MRIAGMAMGLFAAGFLVHWIIWRIRIPRRQTAALLLIFTGVLIGAMAAAVLVRQPAWECLHVAIFHVAMMLAYVVGYSALEQRSPSMSLLTFVADAHGEGRTRQELMGVLEGAMPVEARLSAMVRDGMILESDGAYQLTPKGRSWAMVLSSWRRLLGMPRGG